jgi:hypothetical protein
LIFELVVDPKTGTISQGPEPILRYTGTSKATVLGLAEGPDGLYFTDFFGESKDLDDESKGRVWRLAPSKATLGLPEVDDEALASLSPAQRGGVHFAKNCLSCHRMNGVGGREGPDLTHARSQLLDRLSSRPYNLTLEKLLQSESSFMAQQRGRLQDVLNAGGEERVRVWIGHHLEEPRFDHPFAKMPSFAYAMKPAQRAEVVEHLMERN